jgi:hypothetical protein
MINPRVGYNYHRTLTQWPELPTVDSRVEMGLRCKPNAFRLVGERQGLIYVRLTYAGLWLGFSEPVFYNIRVVIADNPPSPGKRRPERRRARSIVGSLFRGDV